MTNRNSRRGNRKFDIASLRNQARRIDVLETRNRNERDLILDFNPILNWNTSIRGSVYPTKRALRVWPREIGISRIVNYFNGGISRDTVLLQLLPWISLCSIFFVSIDSRGDARKIEMEVSSPARERERDRERVFKFIGVGESSNFSIKRSFVEISEIPYLFLTTV